MTGEREVGPLALRLAAAFLVVAVAAIAVLGGLIVLAASNETTALVDRQHEEAAHVAAAATADAVERAGSLSAADLNAAGAVAASARARLVVTDPTGAVIAAPTDELASMMVAMHGVATVEQPRGHPVTAPVVVGGDVVGAVTLTFPMTEAGPAEQVRAALWRTVVAGAALAAAAALAVAVFVAARVTRPVVALTTAASRLAAGDRSARAGTGGPGELGTLAATFDGMAARLETEDRLRRQLVTDVAHELRTPLAVLRGETEALLDGVNEPDPAALGSLHDEVLRLTRLVGDLETLAAADAARLDLRRTTVDLADVGRRAVGALRPSAGGAALVLEERLSEAMVEGDPDRLYQVALNLVSNAVKYTPAGGVVTVETRTTGERAVLEVRDTGPGLPGEEAERVFDRFWRGSAGQAAEGSGIGLAVASELVAAHGGTLAALDGSGGGTGGGARFVVDLPLGSADRR